MILSSLVHRVCSLRGPARSLAICAVKKGIVYVTDLSRTPLLPMVTKDTRDPFRGHLSRLRRLHATKSSYTQPKDSGLVLSTTQDKRNETTGTATSLNYSPFPILTRRSPHVFFRKGTSTILRAISHGKGDPTTENQQIVLDLTHAGSIPLLSYQLLMSKEALMPVIPSPSAADGYTANTSITQTSVSPFDESEKENCQASQASLSLLLPKAYRG